LFTDEFDSNKNSSNFPKGVKWSPDGLCLLTNSEDCTIRLFECPREGLQESAKEFSSVFRVEEAETIYDYCWYPRMSSTDVITCCFLSTSRDHPIHLWDAFSGKLRCTYRAFDQMDELTSAYSLSFDLMGEKIYCGYNKVIRIFDVSIPGRTCEEIKCSSHLNGGQNGIISCLSFNPDYSGVFAAGSYSNSVGVYNQMDKNSLICMFPTNYGVTQVQFSPDGRYLFAGGRKSNSITCWDIRNTGQILYDLSRVANTNQRISFDIHYSGSYLATGSQDGHVLIYDVSSGQLVQSFTAHSDAVNGCQFHPTLPYLVTSSGQRKFNLPTEYQEEDKSEKDSNGDCRVLVWYLDHTWTVEENLKVVQETEIITSMESEKNELVLV